jgi:hypothetical protein
MATKTRFIATAAFGLFTLAAHHSFAAPLPKADPVSRMEDQMNRNFSEPRSPETFRALSGMGLPAGAKRPDDEPIWLSGSAEDKALLHSLFPDLKSDSLWNVGACRQEAPLQQFKARIAQLGVQHPYVMQWLRVEQAVLSVCRPGRNKTVATALPEPLDVTDPAIGLLQKQDRAYQQASMLFYQGNNASALAAFRSIADDHASPDRPLAAYMVLAIGAGSQAGEAPADIWGDSAHHAPDSVVLPPEQSLAAIRAVLADPSLQSIHAMAASLIGWIGANVADGPTRSAQVAEAISALMLPTARIEQSPESLKRYEAALSDIDFLHGNFRDSPDWVLTGNVPPAYTASAALAEMARHEPMAAWVAFPTNAYHQRAWVLVATSPETAAVRAYLDRMGANGGDTRNPWVHENPETGAKTLSSLVDDELARLKMKVTDEQAAAGLSLDYYNLIRHLLMDKDDRRRNFEIALQRLEAFPYKHTVPFERAVDGGLQYLITEGRLAEARQIRDALNWDQPDDQMVYTGAGPLLVLAEDEEHLVRLMAAKPFYPREYLNHLSTAELWRLAGRSELNRSQRALFVRAAWSRDYAMGRTISAQHDKLLRALVPEITGTWQPAPGSDLKPSDILLVRDVLKSPGLNTVIEDFSRMPGDNQDRATATLTDLDHFNHNDNNWWCAWDIAGHDKALDEALANDFGLGDEPEHVRDMLSTAVLGSYLFRNIDSDELIELSKVKSAPQFLSEQVIAWVSSTGPFGSRAGQAEALADAILSTRWGCNRQGSRLAYSHAAFKLLHTLFPDTPEAKRTPYWFN